MSFELKFKVPERYKKTTLNSFRNALCKKKNGWEKRKMTRYQKKGKNGHCAKAIFNRVKWSKTYIGDVHFFIT